MPTRRTQLATLGLGLLAAPLAVPLAAPATARAAAPEATLLQVLARRKQITLPALPALGITYIATFDLTDAAGTALGDAFAANSVVDISLAGPVILSQVMLRLAGGEVHYQRVMDRFGAYPRSAPGAILGGTGVYATARGDVQIVWPDADTIQITLNLAA
jgi:hypothetical protein